MGNARSALRLIFWVWLAETALSLAVRLLVAMAPSQPGSSFVLALTFVGAAFVPITLVQGIASLMLARGPAGRAWSGLAGVLFLLHSLLISVQLVAPLLTRVLPAESLMKPLGVALAVAPILGWGMLAASIGMIARQAGAAIAPALETLLTLVFGAVVALVVVNVWFPRPESSWSLATLLVNVVAKSIFLLVVAQQRRALSPARTERAADALGLQLVGVGSGVRAVLLFLVVMMGAAAGSAGLSVVSLVLPPLSVISGLWVALALGLLAFKQAGATRAITLVTLIFGLAALVLDTTTTVQVWRSIGAKAAASSISLGGFGVLAGYASSLGWLGSLAMRARSERRRASFGLALALLALQLALAAVGFVAWRLMSAGQPLATVVVAFGAWLAIGVSLASSTLSVLLAQKPAQSV